MKSSMTGQGKCDLLIQMTVEYSCTSLYCYEAELTQTTY